MTNDTIQQAHIIIRGTEPLLWQPDEPHASLVYAGPDPDAHSHTILVDETTQQLFFAPLGDKFDFIHLLDKQPRARYAHGKLRT